MPSPRNWAASEWQIQMNPLYRKIAWRLVPFLMLLYLVAFLDRVNISFAALTMNRDLGISETLYGFAAGVFFLSYCLFQVPANLVLARMGARRWLAILMVAWGLVSMAHRVCRQPAHLYRRTIPARNCGVRLLSRRHLLLHLLAAALHAHAGAGAVSACAAAVQLHRFADLRSHPAHGPGLRAQGLAVALSHRRRAGFAAGRGDVVRARRQSVVGSVALAGRKGRTQTSHAQRRTGPAPKNRPVVAARAARLHRLLPVEHRHLRPQFLSA